MLKFCLEIYYIPFPQKLLWEQGFVGKNPKGAKGLITLQFTTSTFYLGIEHIPSILLGFTWLHSQ